MALGMLESEFDGLQTETELRCELLRVRLRSFVMFVEAELPRRDEL
jgi:hypothetical protein